MRIRKAGERGHAEHGWLHSWHTFSFADYHDPNHAGHSVLRVINDDTVEPGKGFGTHPHRDMEIVSWVLEGELEHRDSMGNGSIIRPGEVQRMSAGSGVTHSEFNPSEDQRTRFLQIWIVPDRSGYKPDYAQKRFDDTELQGDFCCVVSGDGRNGSVSIHQDASLYLARADGVDVHHNIPEGRCAYVHLCRGKTKLNAYALSAGDGAYIDAATRLDFTRTRQAEILVFDLPIV